MSLDLYFVLLYVWIGVAVLSFFYLLRRKQPYGRHLEEGWGPLIPNKIGWMIMEGVAPIFITYWFITGNLNKTTVSYLIFFLYVGHYFYRSFVFPFLTRTDGKKIPLLVSGSAIFFNFCNTFFLGYYLGNIGGNYENVFFNDPRFFIGISLFVIGLGVNIFSDLKLINLRKPGETGYKIPHGFLFEYISCPNHFGEIIEWFGFAILLGALPGWSFVLWSFVNLVPRALNHHQWYIEKFKEYPKERKAVIPYIL